eukprot:3625341-Prymnesium_polylepis.1
MGSDGRRARPKSIKAFSLQASWPAAQLLKLRDRPSASLRCGGRPLRPFWGLRSRVQDAASGNCRQRGERCRQIFTR